MTYKENSFQTGLMELSVLKKERKKRNWVFLKKYQTLVSENLAATMIATDEF